MIAALPPRTSRPRLTVAQMMLWILCTAFVLAMFSTLLKRWPLDKTFDGIIQVGLICGVLYLPVIPALLFWKLKSAEIDQERFKLVIIFLVFSFVAWLGSLVLAFQVMIRAGGL